MTRLGQVDITTPEPFRWGTGELGDATWSGRTIKTGVYNYRNLTIAADAEILVGSGTSNPADYTLVIFCTGTFTMGNNSVINGQRYGSDSGKNDYDGWRADVYTNYNTTWNSITSGGGGGGGGHNSTSQGGDSSAGSSFKYTTGGGNSFSGNSQGSVSGGVGGNAKYNGNGGDGGNGQSTTTAIKNIIKGKFTYTGKGYWNGPNGTEYRDDFPMAGGGHGAHGGKSRTQRGANISLHDTEGYGGFGGAGVVIVAQKVVFPDAPRQSDAPAGGYPSSGDNTTRAGYSSNAAMIYVRGQTRSVAGDDRGAWRRTPGDHNSAVKNSSGYMSEEGVGGQQSGGTGQHQGMNGKKRGDGGGGGGGAGGGGMCVIVYNEFYGHPTVRCYGGLSGCGAGEQGMNFNSNSGNKGGGGGVGGHGFFAYGWKSIQQGPITWVKDGNFGMKKGIYIHGVNNPVYDYKNTVAEAYHENYSSEQWPGLVDGQYVSKAGNLQAGNP